MSLQAVFFDWDGTITDSMNVKTQAFVELFSPYGSEITNKIIEHQKMSGGISRFEKYKFYMKEYLHQSTTQQEMEEFGRQFSAICYQNLLKSPFIPGAIETLNKLKQQNILTFVITGSPTSEICQLAIERNIDKLFTEIHGSPLTKEVLIQNLLSKYNLKPQNTLFFGDALADYQAAKTNLVPFIGICTTAETSPFPQKTIIQSQIKI